MSLSVWILVDANLKSCLRENCKSLFWMKFDVVFIQSYDAHDS